jgi:hypothetical protein
MHDEAIGREPNDWEVEFLRLCEELQQSLLGVYGNSCIVVIEQWEIKYQHHRHVGFSVRDHARGMKATLFRTASQNSTMTIHNYGNSNNIQVGSNVSNAGDNVVAGNENVVLAPTKEQSTPIPISNRTQYWNIGLAVAIGGLAVWWLLPQSMALGQVRAIVTVFLIVCAIVFALLGWFQFRFANWEKLTYVALGSILIIRSAIPSVVGGLGGNASLSQDSALANVNGYLGVTDNVWSSGLNLIGGLILVGFAYFAKKA